MTDAELEALAKTIIERTSVRPRIDFRDPQTMFAAVSLLLLLLGVAMAWGATTTQLDTTIDLVNGLGDELRDMRLSLARQDDLLRLEQRVQHLERVN